MPAKILSPRKLHHVNHSFLIMFLDLWKEQKLEAVFNVRFQAGKRMQQEKLLIPSLTLMTLNSDFNEIERALVEFYTYFPRNRSIC